MHRSTTRVMKLTKRGDGLIDQKLKYFYQMLFVKERKEFFFYLFQSEICTRKFRDILKIGLLHRDMSPHIDHTGIRNILNQNGPIPCKATSGNLIKNSMILEFSKSRS